MSDADPGRSIADRDDVAAKVAQDGYAVVPGLVDAARRREVLAAVEPCWAGGRSGRLDGAWMALPAVRRLAVDPAVMDLVGAVLGGPALPFQTLDFRVGTEQRAHADTIHFDTVPSGAMCGLWVALEDVGPEQGPLVVHPRSHRLDVLTPERLGLSADRFDMRAYEDRLEEALHEAGMPALELPVRAGDAVVWAANLAHGGATVRRPGSTRWSQVTHYVRDGSLVVTPMRSVPSRAEYVVRDPLTDLRVGAARPYRVVPGGPSVLHRPGRRSRLVEPGRRVASRARLVSDAVLAARRIRAGVVAQLHGRRRPAPG